MPRVLVLHISHSVEDGVWCTNRLLCLFDIQLNPKTLQTPALKIGPSQRFLQPRPACRKPLNVLQVAREIGLV